MVFRSQKYYKELRKYRREKERQASSSKQQAIDETVPHCDIEEATSSEASSSKLQAPSDKHQA
jgi:hypothetical protein